MGAVVVFVGKGEGRCSNTRDILCRGGSGGTYLRVGDMGYVPTHWEYYGRLPTPGGMNTDGTSDKYEA